MQQKSLIIFCLAVFAVATACSPNLSANGSAASAGQNGNGASNAPANSSKPPAAPSEAQSTPEVVKTAPPSCGDPRMTGKLLIKSQTFPLDFKPFAGSCFVTFASKDDMLDEKDVPRGSTFHVFKDDKKVFDFPDAFGGQSACWIAGVSFNDLNADGLTDVVLAGKCLGAKDSYPANAIYVNTGTAFTTNADANTNIEDLKTLKEIEAFVKKNQKLFF